MAPTTTSALPLPTAIIYPIVEGIAKAYKTPVTFVMVHTVFGAMLIPLLIAMFVFSSARTRRTPIFIGVVTVILLGITLAMWNDYIMVHALLSPLNSPSKATRLGFVWLSFSMSWMVDLVLVFRLLAVYPWVSTPRIKWAIIFSVPFALKSARLGCIISFFIDYNRSYDDGSQDLGGSLANGDDLSIYRSPYFEALWILQMVDNGFIAAMFLWRLRESVRMTASLRREADEIKSSFTNRIRTLFWIALTNFLFPVVLNIIQIAIVFSSPFYTIAYLENVNSYISIYGLAFATVWGASSAQQAPKSSFHSSSGERSVRRMQPRPSNGIESRTINTAVEVDSTPVIDIGKWENAESQDNVALQIMVSRTKETDAAT